MKKILFILLFVLLPFLGYTQSSSERTYQYLSKYSYTYTSNIVLVIDSYVTKEYICDKINGCYYRFKIYSKSMSINNGYTASAYISGGVFYIDNIQLVQNNYPAGFYSVIPYNQYVEVLQYDSYNPFPGNFSFVYTVEFY